MKKNFIISVLLFYWNNVRSQTLFSEVELNNKRNYAIYIEDIKSKSDTLLVIGFYIKGSYKQLGQSGIKNGFEIPGDENLQIPKKSKRFLMPQEILLCKKLQKLQLNAQPIGKINIDLSKLKYLQYLYLKADSLVELPKNFLQIQHLKKLDISVNELKSVPAWLFTHSTLQELDLSYQNSQKGNKDTLLLPAIASNKVLRILSLVEIKTTVLPANFLRLEALEEFNLSKNKFKTLPKEIGNLKNLQILNLSEGKLERLPKEIGQLKKLKSLDLSDCPLPILPNEIGDLESLEILNLSNCPIRVLPDSMINLKNLSEINISGTKLSDFPKILLELPRLKVIIARNSPIVADWVEKNQSLIDRIRRKRYLRIDL
ncbi:MAG: hypothetical protein SFU27_12260 [Thermonemataceae bacterium]|nr:hypothetical protein [Thermonemataceae bacterium]